MTSGPMVFRGPMRGPIGFRKVVGFRFRPFFFLRSVGFGWKNRLNFGEDLFSFFLRSPEFGRKNRLKFGEDLFVFGNHIFFQTKLQYFSVYFGLHKTVNPAYLSWPRAHVWLSAALPVLLQKGWNQLKR